VKVLVVGGGGREHALVWKIAKSPLVEKIYCAPGNAGIQKAAQCVPIAADRVDDLVRFAEEERVDLTVVGPEMPLVLGLVDRMNEKGLKIIGPTQKAAQIEGSKAFAKKLMKRHGIPTGDAVVFSHRDEAATYIRTGSGPLVIKADGLAAGKGVLLCRDRKEAMVALDRIMLEREFGDAGNRVVVEELLKGEEASFIVFTDGRTVVPMPTSQDHKPVFDNDEGPNTGGMGAYSPAPVVTEEMHQRIMEEIMIPAVEAMAELGTPYRGALYAGLMIGEEGPKVLEFNARFGDPEMQPLIMRLESDLVPILIAIVEGELDGIEVRWDPRPAVCVVMASGGYPGSYEKGKEIEGLNDAEAMDDVAVFHAGTRNLAGRIFTDGGRVLGVTAQGRDIESAIKRAYEACSLIRWEGLHYRKDIGRKALKKILRSQSNDNSIYGSGSE